MASPRQEFPGRRAMNRREVLNDLAASESRYVKIIKKICSSYLQPLRDGRVLGKSEIDSIFRTLLDIRDVHSKLNGLMQVASEDDNVANGVALVANEFTVAKAALLEVYVSYARGHEAATRSLKAATVRPEVARVIDNIAAVDERVKGESLEELLLTPLDRLVELRALLQQLVALCAPSDRGYASLSDTIDMFAGILREATAAGYVPSDRRGAGVLSGYDAPQSMSTSLLAPSAALAGASSPDRSPHTAAAAAARSVLHTPGATLIGSSGNSEVFTSSTTAAIVSAAMPLPTSTLSADLAAAGVSTEAVLTAQAEADEAARRLEEMEREVSLKETELSLAHKEVVRAESEARARGKGYGADAQLSAESSSAMDAALRKLQDEERELFQRMQHSEHRAIFEAFLQRKRELEEEEIRLSAALAEHEATLEQVRMRLAAPPSSVMPSDPAKASLYIAWKKALAEREELLRQARKRKHELLRDLKARHETQVILLELERRAAVDGLRDSVAGEREKVEVYKRDLAALDDSIESARAAMRKFKQEFEQLRVALLLDRMAKSTQVANLADRRSRLAKEAEAFRDAVEAARKRVAEEEESKWRSRLQAEKEAGEKRVAEERKRVEQQVEKVRTALAERYEAGFRPLLKEAEARHVAEMERVVALQRELESKEAELRAAHEQARAVSAAVAGIADEENEEAVDIVTGERVPEWKLQEFQDLKNAVSQLWEQLDVPVEDVTAFLSEADLLAPYSPTVLAMYSDMYRRLTTAAALPAPPGPAAATPGPGNQFQLMAPPSGHAATPLSLAGTPYGMNAGAASALRAGVQSVGAPTPGAYSAAAPTPASRAAPTPGSAMAAPAAASSSARARSATRGTTPSAAAAPSSAASGGFRSTTFSTAKTVSDESHYLNKQKQLPPSLGGAGSRRGPSPKRR